MTAHKSERHKGIQAYLQEHGVATVAELCRAFSASEATVRRDLDELAGRALVRRIHGGAQAPVPSRVDLPVYRRSIAQMDEKRAIGRAAATLVEDGETVFLGSGSTVLQVAKCLGERRLTVITNSIPVCNSLSETPAVDVIIAGGFLRKEELSLVGPTVERMLRELRGDKVIMGIQGIHLEHGLTNNYFPESLIDRAIVGFTSQLIIVADHTKFGKANSTFVADLSSVNTIVTDGKTPREFIDALTERGIRIIVADSPESAKARAVLENGGVSGTGTPLGSFQPETGTRRGTP